MTDRTTTKSTTEEYREGEGSLIFIEGPGETGEVTTIFGDRRQVRHKILLKVVTIVTILRYADPGCVALHPLLVIPLVKLDISLRGAGHIVITDKVVLLLELVPRQENIALIK